MEQSRFWKPSSLSGQKNSATFMEPEGALPCLQQPATGPHPELDESSPHLTVPFVKIHFNIIHPSTPRISKWIFCRLSHPMNLICRLPTAQVPNPMFVFRWLGFTKLYVQDRGPV
jgi:hypothetical protein